ncbi:hypothetical protein AB0M28_07030 [Streptomyces sp. NPDC051940]|uniref:hypothetical protein n=1 Tax=Streptomyces sp. NPDC051940 TaxID=3155675 RepID=UPI00344AA390
MTEPPTRDQVIALRDFVDGHLYQVSAMTLSLNGEPPHPPGSDMARVIEVVQALYGVVRQLSQQVLEEPDKTSSAAQTSWSALVTAVAVWRDDPTFPAELRDALPAVEP